LLSFFFSFLFSCQILVPGSSLTVAPEPPDLDPDEATELSQLTDSHLAVVKKTEVSAQTAHVDVLLANAGATWGEAFDTHPDAAFAKVLDLNVRGVFNLVREFMPLLQKRASTEDPSRVVITASVAGLGIGTLGKQGTYGYSASKAAVIHLGRNLAVELGPRGVTVNSICPGFFPSKMSNGLLEIAGGAESMGKANPLRRLGRPEDIAGVVVYLTSRAGAYVNGAAIEIDGGALWQRGQLNVSKL
jgi:NAD(P)-dependent dehydrogenase (short-subunit alcohol dehydrogenase family)